MAAQLTPVPKFKAFDDNGNPLSGGKLYAYSAGTTNPQNTYTDQAAGTPNANPIVLDSRGEANVWLDNSLSYKLVLKTSADVTIWTVDNVKPNPTAISASSLTLSGNGTIGGTLAVTGAVTFSSNLAVGGTLGATGDFAINTNKFNVTASSGNTAIAGTLAVTGATALTGALTVQSNAIAATANRFMPHQAMVRVTKSANQSINSATDTAITWDQETFDTDTLHDTVTNNSRLTAPVTGKYLVIGCLEFAPNNVGYRTVKIRKNGTTDYNSETVVNAGAGDAVRIVITDLVNLAATDYVEIVGVQSSGAGLNVTTVSSGSMTLIGV
jgi:hypothetical protein